MWFSFFYSIRVVAVSEARGGARVVSLAVLVVVMVNSSRFIKSIKALDKTESDKVVAAFGGRNK